MSKFIIECPYCGKYAEGKTGFFARKKIDCACGHTINVRTDKLASRECPHCGNTVVYDQTKGEEAKCPVCGEPINTLAMNSELTEFSCAQCGIRLRTNRTTEIYTCPVCDFENKVKERLVSEKIRTDGLASIIKYEGDNETLVWKHPIEDFNYGSQLIVHESQEAIFFQDGQALDLFGAGRYTLETQQLPLLEKLYKLPTDTEGTFHSEVYFINKVVQMAIKWGTPEKVRFIDPLTGVPLELGASGEMSLQVSDSRKLLLKLVGTMKGITWDSGEGLAKSLQASFRPLITNAVKTNLSSTIKEEAIDLLEVDEKLELLSARLREKLLPGFEEYGLTIPQFFVTSVVLPESDPNFKRIRELHTITLQTRVYQAEAVVKTAQAQSEAQYRTAQEQSAAAIEAAHREAVLQKQTTETEVARRAAERTVISAQAEAEAQRMSGLAEAEVMRAKGYSEKDVIQAGVQKSYAESIGNMGPAIVAGGGSGGGSGILGEMLGLGVGMAAASAVAPQIGTMMQGLRPQETAASAPAAVPASGGDTWDCPGCGHKNISSRFCPDCGTAKPEARPADSWDCPSCGAKGIRSKFCPECGARKPEPDPGWTCPACGKTDIHSKFCPECGAAKPAPGWDCPDCGQKNIMSGFCPNCGRKRD
ncbi:MAG: SPFH domain-containing protein [Oscillospiraceae bacterium]|nr:SPFH domain-containing protein [Oscillospiraceae bacterium]